MFRVDLHQNRISGLSKKHFGDLGVQGINPLPTGGMVIVNQTGRAETTSASVSAR